MAERLALNKLVSAFSNEERPVACCSFCGKIALRRERDQEAAARVALEREASLLRERMHEMEAHASARWETIDICLC